MCSVTMFSVLSLNMSPESQMTALGFTCEDIAVKPQSVAEQGLRHGI